MKCMSFFSLVKSELRLLVINPASFIGGLFFLFANIIYFFYGNNFFVQGLGSTDLRFLFECIPFISILYIPTITMGLWSKEDVYLQLPISSFSIVFSKWLASFLLISTHIIALSALVFVVLIFGTVELPLVITGFIGILLFSACLTFFSLLCSVFFRNQAVSFFVSSLLLAITIFNNSFKYASFSWCFDAFSKGILDTSNIFFFIILMIVFLVTAVFIIEYRKFGSGIKNITKSSVVQLYFARLIFLIVLLCNTQIFFIRVDVTENKRFSLSDYSNSLLENVVSRMSIRYYVSKEFSDMYPHVRDVEDFLLSYAHENKHVVVKIDEPTEDSEIAALSSLGVVAQKLPFVEKNKTSLISVYSAVVVEYQGRTEIIPFVFDATNLEFDMASILLSVTEQLFRGVHIVVGNGLSLSNDYPFVEPMLKSAGFATSELPKEVLLQNSLLDVRYPLLLLGSSALSREEIEGLDYFVHSGGKVFFSVSPVDINLDTWVASFAQEDNGLFDLLEHFGFYVDNDLLQDTNSLTTQLLSSSGETIELKYPFFVDIPLGNHDNESFLAKSFKGLSMFWSTPLKLSTNFNGLEKISYSNETSWLQKENSVLIEQGQSPFITNPFFEHNTTADSKTQSFTVAAHSKNLVVVSDQYFLSRATNYVNQASVMKNFDFLINALLYLHNQESLITLKSKSFIDYSLHKISDEKQFRLYEKTSVFILFVFYFIFTIAPYVYVVLERKIKSQKGLL